jgi:hypothetical protein
MSKGGIVTNYRSAVTGRFVPKSHVKTHKATTETEKNRKK